MTSTARVEESWSWSNDVNGARRGVVVKTRRLFPRRFAQPVLVLPPGHAAFGEHSKGLVDSNDVRQYPLSRFMV